nr:immunoglobulin light chain junction region [Macaca mulatta]MOY04970.1 immunoglobulin light chain junction region [Macaca mulatta]MOY05387.1 immunoglobulin light chain junction region [Macaca mulatta]MOY05453.1 immunoglobulin light chain junction region [Macaca mulatta]MOY05725.1 immunoglobulin light chain junction region [Macaca mulatta]
DYHCQSFDTSGYVLF